MGDNTAVHRLDPGVLRTARVGATLHGGEQPLPPYRPWLERFADFDPRRVLFAHDCSVREHHQ